MIAQRITAPFTAAQVEALNDFQRWGRMHPFTCPQHSDEALEARTDGWHCTHPGCGYTQDWAHDFMAKGHFCTKAHPRPADAPESEYWIHVDAVNVLPEWDGDRVPFRCPHCGIDFEVEF